MIVLDKKIQIIIKELEKLNNDTSPEEVRAIINQIKDPFNKSLTTITSELLNNPKIIPIIKKIIKELEKKNTVRK